MVKDKEYYPWEGPKDKSKSKMQVANSLTGTKVPFAPNDGGNLVKWYICGPTVYDESHVGHASNYVRFDIVRRILSDYFGYDVVVQMNVTDVDDKIIKRANERKIPFHELSQHFEKDFMDDMDNLNVRRPDFVTRVSDYIPEVVSYIEKLIENGFAYHHDGSVYFDTASFVDSGYNYGKLEPWSVGDASLMAEGEGVLTAQDDTVKDHKKSPNDFAVWKKSKENEPTWESPWGLGRPGWHIECSAMAYEILGPVIDIHAGGEDLKFPHHSNEIAQAEAFHKSHQWVNYFLHAGHLHIEGLKMSKSLKNFITIKKCLERYNARHLRILFLGHNYDAPMNYAEHAMDEAINLDRKFVDFFGNLKAKLRDIKRQPLATQHLRPDDLEKELAKELTRTQEAIHNCISDNFNTPGAMTEIQNLIRSTNSYIASAGEKGNAPLLETIGRYITKMFKIFGLSAEGIGEIGYGEGGSGDGQSREDTVGPVLDAFAEYRDKVRQLARNAPAEVKNEILQLSDSVRDDVLPPLGVRLEDRGNDQPAIWKLEDSESLILEIQRKRDEEKKKADEKERLKLARLAKQMADLEKGRLAPELLFKEGEEYRGKYSEYDESGLPIKDADGKELTKSARKGLQKAQTRQMKLHEKFLASDLTT